MKWQKNGSSIYVDANFRTWGAENSQDSQRIQGQHYHRRRAGRQHREADHDRGHRGTNQRGQVPAQTGRQRAEACHARLLRLQSIGATEDTRAFESVSFCCCFILGRHQRLTEQNVSLMSQRDVLLCSPMLCRYSCKMPVIPYRVPTRDDLIFLLVFFCGFVRIDPLLKSGSLFGCPNHYSY